MFAYNSLRIKKIAYLAVIAIMMLPLIAYQVGEFFTNAALQAWLTPFMLFVIIPGLDFLVGRDEYNPTNTEEKTISDARYYQWLSMLVVPLQLINLSFGIYVFTSHELTWLNSIGWLISIGLISGGIGITVAHELIHKSNKLEPLLGGFLLSTVCYATFKVEHLRGHHVHVSTPEDASSAPKGEGIYHFLWRAIPNNISNAWHLEAQRLTRKGKHWLTVNNELINWSLLSITFAIASYLSFGLLGLLFFISQSAIAILLLEVINYVEHYGLTREKTADGRYEKVTHLHSWNSPYLITNIMLFQLQRHSDHHESPKRRYQALRSYSNSPQLPAGYPSMFLLAMIPWAWKKIMDPIVDKHMARQAEIRTETVTSN